MQMNLISQEAQRLHSHYRNFVCDYVTWGQAGCHLINGLTIWQEAHLQKTTDESKHTTQEELLLSKGPFLSLIAINIL